MMHDVVLKYKSKCLDRDGKITKFLPIPHLWYKLIVSVVAENFNLFSITRQFGNPPCASLSLELSTDILIVKRNCLHCNQSNLTFKIYIHINYKLRIHISFLSVHF